MRVITNRSSGKMGYRLAEAAWRRGAQVTLVSGPSHESVHAGIAVVRIESTEELRERLAELLPASDVLIMAAAPADFAPAHSATEKTPRQRGALTLDLKPTPDILSDTKSLRKPGMLTVGFALETGDAVAKGRAKLERKHLDLIVVNDATVPGAGFDVDTNVVSILHRDGRQSDVSLATKAEVAEAILDVVESEL